MRQSSELVVKVICCSADESLMRLISGGRAALAVSTYWPGKVCLEGCNLVPTYLLARYTSAAYVSTETLQLSLDELW